MAEAIQHGRWICPACKRAFDPDEDLRDAASLRVYFAVGICQDCQDVVYGEEGVPVMKMTSGGLLSVLTKTLQ